MIARSLSELMKLKGSATQLLLSGSADLVCNNLFCEKVTKPCLCRLERVLEVAKPVNVEVVDLSNNGLDALPPSVTRLPRLRLLDLRNNAFLKAPKELESLGHVQVLIDAIIPQGRMNE